MTNQYGEIRLLDLVMSKSHSQYEAALHDISQSLTQYGHKQPKVIWTDNVRGDKGVLERAFVSLLEGVDPIVKYSELEELTLPSTWSPIVHNTFEAIERAMSAILGELSDEGGKEKIAVGFDMEWAVDLASGWQGPTALVQVAYGNIVNLLQVRFAYRQFLRFGH